jgi:hypothetical protein
VVTCEANALDSFISDVFEVVQKLRGHAVVFVSNFSRDSAAIQSAEFWMTRATKIGVFSHD